MLLNEQGNSVQVKEWVPSKALVNYMEKKEPCPDKKMKGWFSIGERARFKK